MNDATTPPADSMESIRREIDRLDDAILALVAERLRLGEGIAAAKPAGLPLRPGREITMMRRLIAAAPAHLDRDLVVELWRALIAANVRRQRVIDVVVGGGRGDPTRLYDIARRHFGARARIQHVGEPQAALQKVLEKPEDCVAVTPWATAPGVGSWWPALSESRYARLHLIAGLPVAGPIGDDPEASVFAAAEPEEAGGDVTLILAFDPPHRAQRALNEAGLTGKEVTRSEPRIMLRVEGFIAPHDPRAAALTSQGLEGVRVIGSYARV
ncbi:MAG TPA: chorismate mutase [Terricaulis sp.]|nr:chorismate mutase [Terricaulis sp.]